MLILCNAYFVLNFFQCFILTLKSPFNSKVQLTYESVTNNTLPFLECLIESNNEGRLQTKIYPKKTLTGQYILYTSNQAEHVKVGTINVINV